MTDRRQSASEVGYAIAAIAPALPGRTRRQLAALLAHTIAAPLPGTERAQRLGLACELVASGADVSVQAYERLRQQRPREEWPAASTLVEHFGSWAMVLRLAMQLQFRGMQPPVRSSHRELRRAGGTYSRQEVTDAVKYVARIVGYVPGTDEYAEIRRVVRRHARLTGTSIPRLPAVETIGKLFDSYMEAAEIAARELRELGA